MASPLHDLCRGIRDIPGRRVGNEREEEEGSDDDHHDTNAGLSNAYAAQSEPDRYPPDSAFGGVGGGPPSTRTRCSARLDLDPSAPQIQLCAPSPPPPPPPPLDVRLGHVFNIFTHRPLSNRCLPRLIVPPV